MWSFCWARHRPYCVRLPPLIPVCSVRLLKSSFACKTFKFSSWNVSSYQIKVMTHTVFKLQLNSFIFQEQQREEFTTETVVNTDWWYARVKECFWPQNNRTLTYSPGKTAQLLKPDLMSPLHHHRGSAVFTTKLPNNAFPSAPVCRAELMGTLPSSPSHIQGNRNGVSR